MNKQYEITEMTIDFVLVNILTTKSSLTTSLVCSDPWCINIFPACRGGGGWGVGVGVGGGWTKFYYVLTLISIWIGNHMHTNMWDEIT